ncbi:hypothetical protein [Inhella gelatinilytica]|uniref:Carboxypeptidase regulatory-like domain-containing protein n=1 Tax=Inhella gelatinilytica TaxID=2795030 RepID=A0A931NEJ3_9BURK|nr:hypothetical protein [Inhella gelatinilytica]MBH9552576.1 hypothetical protein [Inhella gelatinilytica]
MRCSLTLPLLVFALLSACGGKGDGEAATPPGSSASAPPPTPPILSGVVSVGAPVGGATVSVVDAKGVALGKVTANAVDGSYRLTLPAASPALPLLLQAQGVDAAGLPVLFHTLVPTAANSATTTVHLTPLTQAVTALALGDDPAPSFAKAADAGLVDAGKRVADAATFLKSLLKSPLTDVKITDASKLDLISDAGFATSKSSADLLLESTRVWIDRESGKLALASKFVPSPAAEVEVKLSTAKTELAKGSTGVPASAVTTTAVVTSAAATVLPPATTLDGIVTTLNPLLAQTGASATTFSGSTALTGYTQHEGRTLADLANLLLAWNNRGLQLGPLQILGCLDEVITKGNCLRVAVASAVTDRSGKVQERLINAATYSATTKRWSLVGNGKGVGFAVVPFSAQHYLFDGTVDASAGTTPGKGVEVRLTGQPSGISSATVQTAIGFALPLATCQQTLLCVAPVGAVSVIPTGGPSDQWLTPGTIGWLGGADAVRGALFRAGYSTVGGAETAQSYLPTSMELEPTTARHPVLEGLSTEAPLALTQLMQGVTVKWSTWAAAQPDLRVLRVRALLRYSNGVLRQEVVVEPGATQAAIPAFGAVPTRTVAEVWLEAADGQGRRHYSRYLVKV